MTGRYVVVGLAHVRSAWFTEVSRWATVGALPVEFVKCLSVEEVRSQLGSGRPLSAALLDARHPAVDRDLLAAVARTGAAPLVVADATRTPDGSQAAAAADGADWVRLGARAIVSAPVERGPLLAALVEHASPIDDVVATTGSAELSTSETSGRGSGWRAPLVAVTGGPGTGRSTLAAALAQALADDPARRDQVLLADLARRAHHGVLHDAGDVVPGLTDLVDAHRIGRPTTAEVVDLTHAVPSRGYHLLLGLRRPGQWVSLRPEALAATVDSLRRTFRAVVADVDDDLEGEAETGSHDIGDRNLLARTVVTAADLVVCVGSCTSTGVFDLVRLLEDLRHHGVPGPRILVVANRGPARARARAELTRTLAGLLPADPVDGHHLGPVFVRARRGIDDLHRDVVRFPTTITSPLALAVAPFVVGPSSDPLQPTSTADRAG